MAPKRKSPHLGATRGPADGWLLHGLPWRPLLQRQLSRLQRRPRPLHGHFRAHALLHLPRRALLHRCVRLYGAAVHRGRVALRWHAASLRHRHLLHPAGRQAGGGSRRHDLRLPGRQLGTLRLAASRPRALLLRRRAGRQPAIAGGLRCRRRSHLPLPGEVVLRLLPLLGRPIHQDVQTLLHLGAGLRGAGKVPREEPAPHLAR